MHLHTTTYRALLRAAIVSLALCYCSLTDTASAGCAVDVKHYTCGETGISQQDCESLGCCWVEGDAPTEGLCFKRADHDSSATNTEDDLCGTAASNEEACLRLEGCTWSVAAGRTSCVASTSVKGGHGRKLRLSWLLSPKEGSSRTKSKQKSRSYGSGSSSSVVKGSTTTTTSTDLETGDVEHVSESEASATSSGSSKRKKKAVSKTKTTSQTPDGSVRIHSTTDTALTEAEKSQNSTSSTVGAATTTIADGVETTESKTETASEESKAEITREVHSLEDLESVTLPGQKEIFIHDDELTTEESKEKVRSEESKQTSSSKTVAGATETETRTEDSQEEATSTSSVVTARTGDSYELETEDGKAKQQTVFDSITGDYTRESEQKRGSLTETESTTAEGVTTVDAHYEEETLKDTVEEKAKSEVETESLVSDETLGLGEDSHMTKTTERSDVDFEQKHVQHKSRGLGPLEGVPTTRIEEQTEGETTEKTTELDGLSAEKAAKFLKTRATLPEKASGAAKPAWHGTTPEGAVLLDPAEDGESEGTTPEETQPASKEEVKAVITTTKDTVARIGTRSFDYDSLRERTWGSTSTSEEEGKEKEKKLGYILGHSGAYDLDYHHNETTTTTTEHDPTTGDEPETSKSTTTSKGFTLDLSRGFKLGRKGGEAATKSLGYSKRISYKREKTVDEDGKVDYSVGGNVGETIQCVVVWRTRCGAKRITEDECLKLNCCWSSVGSFLGSTSCYKPNTLAPSPSPRPKMRRSVVV